MSELENVKIELIDSQGTRSACWAPKGKNLWEILTINNMYTGAYCGGRKNCGKCKVRIEGDAVAMTDAERGQLLPEEIKAGVRLACYLYVSEPLTVYLDYMEPMTKPKLALKRNKPESTQYPPVKLRQFFIPGVDREQPLPVMTRLHSALPDHSIELTLKNMNELAALDRIGRPAMELYALIFNEQRVKYIGRHPGKALGVAVDLGSTSLFAALVDLTSGEILALSSMTNMQRIYGADIISRVAYCMEHEDGINKMRQVLVNNVNSMIADMLGQAQCEKQDIYSISVVGNPVMLHFITGINVNGFAIAPYAGVFREELLLTAAQAELMAASDALVVILPQIGGFVGADTVGGLLSLGKPGVNTFLYIDIGTNAEIVLFNKGEMWAASAPAGPAFEGGGIACGMRAASGAIDRVSIHEDGNLSFNVLGNDPARGLCGSGIIDLVGCLWQAGFIDINGTINELGYQKLSIRSNQLWPEILISEGQNPVVFTQDDIRQVQLAKSAIRSAIDILCMEARIKTSNIEGIYIAGAFGNYLDPEQAIRIGILPPITADSVINCGNAAANGAIDVLLSEEKRKQARLLAGRIKYVELAMRSDFQEIFLKNLDFRIDD
ncbi:MAG: ASKHA domain-containing protein [Deltaproteobacteria bacterium]